MQRACVLESDIVKKCFSDARGTMRNWLLFLSLHARINDYVPFVWQWTLIAEPGNSCRDKIVRASRGVACLSLFLGSRSAHSSSLNLSPSPFQRASSVILSGCITYRAIECPDHDLGTRAPIPSNHSIILSPCNAPRCTPAREPNWPTFKRGYEPFPSPFPAAYSSSPLLFTLPSLLRRCALKYPTLTSLLSQNSSTTAAAWTGRFRAVNICTNELSCHLSRSLCSSTRASSYDRPICTPAISCRLLRRFSRSKTDRVSSLLIDRVLHDIVTRSRGAKTNRSRFSLLD